MEGDLLGVTSTGEPEYPTSAVCSAPSEIPKIDTGSPASKQTATLFSSLKKIRILNHDKENTAKALFGV